MDIEIISHDGKESFMVTLATLLQLYSSIQNTFNVNEAYGLLIGDASVVS